MFQSDKNELPLRVVHYLVVQGPLVVEVSACQGLMQEKGEVYIFVERLVSFLLCGGELTAFMQKNPENHHGR